MSRGEQFMHFCHRCGPATFYSFLIASIVFLGLLRWSDETKTADYQRRMARVEAAVDSERGQRNAEAIATRVLLLALVADPPPPPEKVEVIEVNVKKAIEPYGLSPVIADLLRELRTRSRAQQKAAARANPPA